MAKNKQTGKTASGGGPKRGEIHLAAFDSLDPQPVLVVQNDVSNRYSSTVLVAPLDTTVRLPLSPLHVLLPAGAATGLNTASVVMCNQIRSVERSRLVRRLGETGDVLLAQVDEALRAALGLPEFTTPGIVRAISEGAGEIRVGRYDA